MLYENQNIYIVSSVGDQAKQTFSVLESLITRIGKSAATIKSLQDIAEKEVVKNGANKTGFSHNPAGYEVGFYNGSKIFTLNSNPDSVRGKRANLVFFDEAAFCSEELLVVAAAFCTQSSDFQTSTDSDYNPEIEKRKVPNKLVYASSQNTNETLFYKFYKDFAKRMLAGDREYFVCDMICDTAITTFMNGKPYVPLLSRKTVEDALAQNPIKAEREYLNRCLNTHDPDQIVSWSTIRRNETFYIPTLSWNPGSKYIIAFDPCRLNDNAIVLIGELYEDERMGICCKLVNCINMIDKKTNNKYKLPLPKQREKLKTIILTYNGYNADYEFIDEIMFDAGAGGQVYGIIDDMMSDWKDDKGIVHRGFIDKTSDVYKDYINDYPNAADKIRLISPKKYRTQMFKELIELVDLGVIKFPYEYDGGDYINMIKSADDEEEIQENYELSAEEKISLAELDLLKAEITSIQKITNKDKTSETYQLSTEAQRKGYHDDRAYSLILLAHRLYELRHQNIISKTKAKPSIDDFLGLTRQAKKYS